MPRLIDLLSVLPSPSGRGWREASGEGIGLEQEITGITADSRAVRPGFVFVALEGEKVDGHEFISQAIQNGALAVIADKKRVLAEDTRVIPAANTRRAFAQLAAAFYPRQPEHVVAVTGTDGKTSTADFYRQFWYLMGARSAAIGTLGITGGDGRLLSEGTHTTPDPMTLHQQLSSLPADYVCMEASSHGIHQSRLDGVRLEAAAFTYIGRDHLDYHKTEDNYFLAKARLFDTLLGEGKTAVINQDDKRYSELHARCLARRHRIIGFGRGGSDFRIHSLELLPHGQRAQLELFGKHYTVEVPLVGAFQTMNILAALGLVVGSGGDIQRAVSVIPRLAGVPGRLEKVADLDCGAVVYIDYAHTPMALANILHTLRPHTPGLLHVVFGCGGDRDAGKRPEMGRIAAELADRVIVTDDNPRSENPATIRSQIMAASSGAKEVADRREAIYVALGELRAGDVLVIAGKGHEKTQTIAGKVLPFDDAEVARAGVRELKL
ncbi:MAG: UDP-N-acetylmuramoyl-L-alanyl-D-glutamate--2,6-diaminopimelate ligase [Alphaproteobacteria bacterium]|nr:UDP-N-acetylmuramoyl-L-alanyl-D-glutamate--2,6-diaminopimelate ligase [Alphaproteobacteria bacterium]